MLDLVANRRHIVSAFVGNGYCKTMGQCGKHLQSMPGLRRNPARTAAKCRVIRVKRVAHSLQFA